MKNLVKVFVLSVLGSIGSRAASDGDPVVGKELFARCKSCHSIVTPEGVILYAGGRQSLNLWGLEGRAAGMMEGHKYSKAMLAAGAAGLIWERESFIAYIADPRAFLRSYLEDETARSSKAFFLKRGAEDLWAYIVTSADGDTGAAQK